MVKEGMSKGEIVKKLLEQAEEIVKIIALFFFILFIYISKLV